MAEKYRHHPKIPDHEVFRKIGGGAYGEVWLARGVTGAMRAVKVVWREDFDDERGFEREFEGILKYEPISRDHPGLVNVLHVGRSTEGPEFYYYVMELGDDVTQGQEINPIEYEPRTLRADNRQTVIERLDLETCIDVGVRLAEALDHLHGRGLAHRDVKPSNVIFVNGRAKLADIGLVAARGQRTFVGTEGFVPPEGPGSAQADVYSLGKVLYEIVTGKDRMEFPELPEEMPEGSRPKRWHEFNRIICEVCEPRLSKRRISTAAQLAESLRRLQRGKRRRRSGLSVALTACVILGFAGWAGWHSLRDSEWYQRNLASPASVPAPMGLIRVASAPEGAEVVGESGEWLGTTPTGTMEARVGEELVFTIRQKGFRTMEIHEIVPASAAVEPYLIYAEMQVFSPPQLGEPWVDHLGQLYQPDGDEHISSNEVMNSTWATFAQARPDQVGIVEVLPVSRDGIPADLVLVSQAAADAFCQWLEEGAREAGFLTEDHEVLAVRNQSFQHPEMSDAARQEGLQPLWVMVRKIPFGVLEVMSSPPGADVYLNREPVGQTDPLLRLTKVPPGRAELLFVMEGYKPLTREVVMEPNGLLRVEELLQANQGVVFGKPWENSLGMRFVPLGTELMVAIWETRVGDYATYVAETGAPLPAATDFPQDNQHPVVNVSREDAEAFCVWLTIREQQAERIARQHAYRLPTDLEWSEMAGLANEGGISPGWRDSRKKPIFPWGGAWLGRHPVGNFADVSAAMQPGMSRERTISNYDDGYPFTAPVGSFPPNPLGIYDLSGNVHEWVSDPYSSSKNSRLGVLRGGGWNTYQPEDLSTGARNGMPPTYRDAMYGFRIVLSKIGPHKDVAAD